MTLKIANHSFRMTPRLVIIHHHTGFGHKRLSGSRDIVRTKSGHTERRRDTYSDSNIPPTHPLHFVTWGHRDVKQPDISNLFDSSHLRLVSHAEQRRPASPIDAPRNCPLSHCDILRTSWKRTTRQWTGTASDLMVIVYEKTSAVNWGDDIDLKSPSLIDAIDKLCFLGCQIVKGVGFFFKAWRPQRLWMESISATPSLCLLLGGSGRPSQPSTINPFTRKATQYKLRMRNNIDWHNMTQHVT